MLAWQIILYSISLGMYYSLLAVGFGLILRSAKFFNVAYGGAILLGGYMMFFFYRVHLVPFVLALLLSVLCSGLYMLLSYRFIFRTLISRHASNFVLLITSFGLLVATAATLGIIFGSQSTLIARKLSDLFTVNVWGGVLTVAQVSAIIGVPIIVILLALIFSKTRFGRAVRAVEDDAEVAELVGIPKEKIISKLFFLSGVLGGLGGIVEGLDVGLNPSSGIISMLAIVVVCIVGGMRSFWGGVLGAFILSFTQRLTIVFIGGSWEQAVPFVVLIIILLVRPQGILER